MRKKIGIVFASALILLGGYWFYQQAKTPVKLDTTSEAVAKEERKGGYSVKDVAKSGENEPILPESADVKNPALILVNKKHPLKKELSFEKAEVQGVPYNALMKTAVTDFLAAAEAAGYPATVVSAYRSIAYQQTVLETQVDQYLAQGYTQADAMKATLEYIQTPGASEHHTGLGIDIMTNEYWQKHHALNPEADETKGQQWLIKHAPDYGFVLRYPKSQAGRDSTGIAYESWHFRYVGVENAQYMTKNTLTLEQYWEMMTAN